MALLLDRYLTMQFIGSASMVLINRTTNDRSTTMDDADEDSFLQNLVLEIKASPDLLNLKDPLAQEVLQSLAKHQKQKVRLLLRSIYGSSRFNKYLASLKAKFQGVANIEDICAEAVNQTLLNVAKNIKKYDPRHTVMQWICGDLKNRTIDLLRQYQRRQHLVPFDMEDTQIQAKMAGIPEDKDADRTTSLRKFIEEDPEGLLTDKHIRNYPAANLRVILLLRLEGYQWQEIADKFEITSHSTVSTFSDRQTQKLLDYFRKHLCLSN
jgi:DNA-directed RNA polymerase specialized sigma24 family protein